MKYPKRRRIVADDEIDVEEDIAVDEDFEPAEDEGDVTVDPEAYDLLFEAEDVAELVAEITQAPVEVTVDDDVVVFAVDGDEFTVEAEGDEEIVESATRIRRRRDSRNVSAATRRPVRRPAPQSQPAVKASTRPKTATKSTNSRVIRKVPKK